MFDGYHCGYQNIASFPFEPEKVIEAQSASLLQLVDALMTDYKKNAERLNVTYSGSGKVAYDSFRVKLSKPIIDHIDRVLAGYYELTPRELDFIINYDIKYRMGDALLDDEEDDED
jgi:hypothetical protein